MFLRLKTRGISSTESDSASESDFSLLVLSSSLVAFSSHRHQNPSSYIIPHLLLDRLGLLLLFD